MVLTSLPDASANQTLAIADNAVSPTMIAVKTQASCHWSERQKASINPQKLRMEVTGIDRDRFVGGRFPRRKATLRVFLPANTTFPSHCSYSGGS